MENMKGKIKEMEFFQGFSDEELSLLLAQMDIRKVPKDEILYEETLEGSEIFWVTEGLFEVKKFTFPVEQPLLQLGPGAPIGELAFIDGHKRSANVIALKDSEGIVLTREKFDRLKDENPQLAFKLLMALTQTISFRLRETTQRFVELA